jgi:hypothetical protein
MLMAVRIILKDNSVQGITRCYFAFFWLLNEQELVRWGALKSRHPSTFYTPNAAEPKAITLRQYHSPFISPRDRRTRVI